MNSLRFKVNFSIFTKLKLVFNIPLLPNAKVQITAIIEQCVTFTPETRKQNSKYDERCLVLKAGFH